MNIQYDEQKRQITLEQRGLDFADAWQIFEGTHYTLEDDRQNYGEQRLISIGLINKRMAVAVWTPRAEDK
ncbi:BrnT family toxin [Thiomicrorhabdus aquaedulcis]|uniref:BrnT family toxin n=1 Tax=Thiomicrorhabdus aquaedulcis TaxID=2211106 RepID=UPI000FDBA6CA|nr:BrnT family toxin [Thiomicrorhabdus aquaedulcis]